MTIMERHVDTPLDELTFDELDELGQEITWAIGVADEAGYPDLVDKLIGEKNRVNKLKAAVA